MRVLSLAVLVWLAVLPARAVAQAVTATVVEAGEFVADFYGSVPSPKSLTGSASVLTNPKLVEQTDLICPRRGLRFGIRYKVDGKPQKAPITFAARIIFPSPGLRLPGGGLKTESELSQSPRIGQTRGHFFTFAADWTMVPGPWIFEVHHMGRLLLRKAFTVACVVA